MLKIPNAIRIGSIDYDIKFFKGAIGNTDLGQHDGKNSTIELTTDTNPQMQFKTFVHEVLHAIIFQYGVDIPEEQEEQVVIQLTSGVTEFIEQMLEEKNR